MPAGASALVRLLGLGAELLHHALGEGGAALFLWSLSYEGNLPSWYASVLPLLCAGLLAAVAAGEAVDRGRWRMLAVGFVYISIDEAGACTSGPGELFDTEGVLHFGWVIPAAAVVLGVGLAFLGFCGAWTGRPRGASSSRARSMSRARCCSSSRSAGGPSDTGWTPSAMR